MALTARKERKGSVHGIYALLIIALSVVLASTVMLHFNGSSPGPGVHSLTRGVESFGSNAVTGNAVSSRANILQTTIGVCEQNLTAGYNTFSSYCVVPNGSISDTLAYVYQDYKSLYYYDAFDAQNPWKAYVPSLPSWVKQGISKMDDLKGYIILMKINQTLVINGTEASPRIVPYANGYSLVGFPHSYPINTSNAFSNSSGTVIAVFWHNGSFAGNANISAANLSYIGYNLISDSGQLQMIRPGMGLWLNASSAGTWTLG